MEKHYPIINILQKVAIAALILTSIFKLYQYFEIENIQSNLEENIALQLNKGILTYQTQNIDQRRNAQFLTLRRPDDSPLVKWVDSSSLQLQQAIKSLKKHSNDYAKDTLAVLDFYHQICVILDSISDAHPLVRDDEVKTLKEQMLKKCAFPSNLNQKLSEQLSINQVHFINQIFTNYSLSKIGGTVLCCFWIHQPTLHLPPSLPIGKTYNGEIFLQINHCDVYSSYLMNEKLHIPNENFKAKDGILKYQKLITDSGKFTITAQDSRIYPMLDGNKITFDTIKSTTIFDIYPKN